MTGRYCTLEKLDPERHAADLHAANIEDKENRIWTYLAYGPFASLDAYRAWAEPASRGEDPLFHAIIDAQSGRAVGVASYLRIDPAGRRHRGRPHQLQPAPAAHARRQPRRCS